MLSPLRRIALGVRVVLVIVTALFATGRGSTLSFDVGLSTLAGGGADIASATSVVEMA
ncbi:hypothetical protein NQK81_01895 [Amycolatopsis roodepoortensis]|uniref:hypothetical protein n=1 Tax=Amycolatopsis roodepoortensis TaxID=700274 RepID=UPI00214C54F8|nr:hypothetical protein [Amycolatopsis roodepoortensis]UUV32227.1 hypothetical protein NQK81_01895 [Amycolatopsis roodepoortensis]